MSISNVKIGTAQLRTLVCGLLAVPPLASSNHAAPTCATTASRCSANSIGGAIMNNFKDEMQELFHKYADGGCACAGNPMNIDGRAA